MTYHCGIGSGMAALGLAPQDPHVTCDGDGCEAVESGLAVNDWPKKWLREGKAPPGWKLVPVPDGKARYYCKRCRVTVGPAKKKEAR